MSDTTERIAALEELENLIAALDKTPAASKSHSGDRCRQYLSDIIKKRTPAQKALAQLSGL